MEKETLKLAHIKQDLDMVARTNISNLSDWHYMPALSAIMGAIVVGIYTNNVWIGILIALFGVPGGIRYMIELKKYKNQENELNTAFDRNDISISVLKLSHIATETVYEPHTHGSLRRNRHRHYTKQVKFFYFVSGGSWRVPKVSTHYKWSNKYNFSTQGLENISVSGNDFYSVHLQGNYNVSYIYPCNYFKLDCNLKISE